MAEPQSPSGGLTDEAALSCCSDADPSTKVGAGPKGTDPRAPLGRDRAAFYPTPSRRRCRSAGLGLADGSVLGRGIMVFDGAMVGPAKCGGIRCLSWFQRLRPCFELACLCCDGGWKPGQPGVRFPKSWVAKAHENSSFRTPRNRFHDACLVPVLPSLVFPYHPDSSLNSCKLI